MVVVVSLGICLFVCFVVWYTVILLFYAAFWDRCCCVVGWLFGLRWFLALLVFGGLLMVWGCVAVLFVVA